MTTTWAKESAKLRYDKVMKFTTIFTVTMLGVLAGIVTQHDEDISITILRNQNRDMLFAIAAFTLIIGLIFSLWKLRMIEKIMSDDKSNEFNSKSKRPTIGLKEFSGSLVNAAVNGIEGLQPVIFLIIVGLFSFVISFSGIPKISDSGVYVTVTVLAALLVGLVSAYRQFADY